MTESIQVRIDDVMHTFEQGSSLMDAMEVLKYDQQRGIAVAVNNTVVGKAKWNECQLNTGDNIIVVTATQGG